MLVALLALSVHAAPVTLRIGDVRALGVQRSIALEWVDRVAQQLQRTGAVRVVKSQGDGVLQAEFSHDEQQWKCSIEIRRAREGVLWGETHAVFDSESAAIDWLEVAALDLEADLSPTPILVTQQVNDPKDPAWVRAVPGVAGVAIGAGAATMLILSAVESVRLRNAHDLPQAQVDSLTREQKTLEVTGGVMAGAAAVGVAASVLWFGAAAPTVAVSPSPGGASVSLSGKF